MEHPSLAIRKPQTQEAEAVAKEFLDPFQRIAESRRQLRETEEELKGLVSAVMTKLDSLAELKKENIELERRVLEKLEAELNR